MVKVNIKKKDERIISITVEGHADYGKFGKDIVCSAVSSIVITTINGILRLNGSINYIDNDGYVEINNIEYNGVTEVLLINMIELLTELEKQYPKNIKLFEEVS